MKFTRNNMSIAKQGVPLFVLVLSLVGASCQAKDVSTSVPAPLPPTLMGTWQVTEVHTDQGESHWSRTRNDKYNIHKYLGRVFVFTPQRLTTNSPEDKRCDDPHVAVHHTTAGNAVSTSIASRPFFPVQPTPEDFQLPLLDNAPIEVLSLQCSDGLFAKNLGGSLDPDTGIDGAWLIVLSKDRLALRWHDETILILNRLAANTKPVASFDCTKATTDVEKTICGSVPLAAYDQSVAQTYKLSMEYYKVKKNTDAQIVELKKSQKQWLMQRNACNTDKTCLEKSMGDRIIEMDYEIASHAYDNR